MLNWKANKRNKLLILFGARQVGKTYLIREFAKENYEYLYEINFELDANARNLFNGSLTIDSLLIRLSSYNIKVPIIEGKTLLFFDEVQVCSNVLTALKSFAMNGRFNVITCGSMLRIAMKNVSSYPVGYVETLQMSLMNFEEFLWALGYRSE